MVDFQYGKLNHEIINVNNVYQYSDGPYNYIPTYHKLVEYAKNKMSKENIIRVCHFSSIKVIFY